MPLPRSASISAGGLHREWASPRGSPWARIEITLLIFASIQLLTSIYIYLDRRHDFFFFYLGYAIISWMLMLFRVRYGLVWFALGSLLYCIWLAILTWRAVSASNYVEVCLDFVLAAFEALVLCLSLARFHEVGGFAPCCGEPDHAAKEAAFRVGVKNNARAVIASGQGAAAAGGQWSSLGGEHDDDDAAGMDEEAEAELYLSGSLLAQAHPTGGASAPQRKSSNSTSIHPYSQSQSRNATYIPPQHSSPSSLQPSHTRRSSHSQQHSSHQSPSQPRGVGGVEEAGFVESSSGFFGSSTVDSASSGGISSASSSYSNSIGQGLGPMYGYVAGNRSQAQATPRMPQVLRAQRPAHAASPSDFQSGSFVLSRMPLQHDTMQAQKEQQRLEVQRSNAQTQQTQSAGSMQ